MNRKRTQAQIEASRTNGARSRGPVTQTGKATSARNNTRHGLLSETLLLPDEDQSRPLFQALQSALTAEFTPETESEKLTVEALAETKWRQMQAWRTVANASSGTPPSRANIVTLHRYDTRFSRRYEALRAHLARLKSHREITR
jgi:hypothetical protein